MWTIYLFSWDAVSNNFLYGAIFTEEKSGSFTKLRTSLICAFQVEIEFLNITNLYIA